MVRSAFRWLKHYFLRADDVEDRDSSLFREDEVEEAALFVTGDGLINRIREAIVNRRSVLVTGPRGCGKSYCSESAIRAATREGHIGGWRFLQGNREIPRDLLSEDMLVIGPSGRPVTLKALALRPLENEQREQDGEGSIDNSHRAPKEYRERFGSAARDWPGIPTRLCIEEDNDPRSFWRDEDWLVLYLDEINRFGDGFLDSLLSVTEEGKIIRRGEDYYVPMIVIATANPPGYDSTAKKLSPPLQARISLAYRVSQPPIDILVNVIIKNKLEALQEKYRKDAKRRSERGEQELMVREFEVPVALRWLAAAATLALWGHADLDKGGKGIAYLTEQTRRMLLRLMDLDATLQRAMTTMSRLIEFGPDSRAVCDWLYAAIGLAFNEHNRTSLGDQGQSVITLERRHLMATAVEVLGHKVRENFNEGTEPGKVKLKEYCITEVVRQVLENPRVEDEVIPLDSTIASLCLGTEDPEDIAAFGRQLSEAFSGFPEERRQAWRLALKELAAVPQSSKDWRGLAIGKDALTRAGDFHSQDEKRTLHRVLELLRTRASRFAIMVDAIEPWPWDVSVQLRRLLSRQPTLRRFGRPLEDRLGRLARSLKLMESDQTNCWLSALEQIVARREASARYKDRILWRTESAFWRAHRAGQETATQKTLFDRAPFFRLMRASLDILKNSSNRVGYHRCKATLGRLDVLEGLRVDKLVSAALGPDRFLQERADLSYELRSSAEKLFERLARDNVSERIIHWFQGLEQTVHMSSANAKDLVQRWFEKAKELGLMTPGGYYYNKFERDWFLEELVAPMELAKAPFFVKIVADEQAMTLLRRPISATWVLERLLPATQLFSLPTALKDKAVQILASSLDGVDSRGSRFGDFDELSEEHRELFRHLLEMLAAVREGASSAAEQSLWAFVRHYESLEDEPDVLRAEAVTIIKKVKEGLEAQSKLVATEHTKALGELLQKLFETSSKHEGA